MFLKSPILKILISLPVIAVCLLACEKEPPIPEETFIKVYADIVIAQDTSGQVSAASVKETVLKKYNATENDYEQTIDYYNDDPLRWESFFDKVIKHVENLQKNGAKQKTD